MTFLPNKITRKKMIRKKVIMIRKMFIKRKNTVKEKKDKTTPKPSVDLF